jgi:hypothetical protein
MGEDLAPTRTKDEELKFNTTIQKNLPSSRSKYNSGKNCVLSSVPRAEKAL